ncbi:AAA family ATPase [Uliginosibacterium gangwonense]|uniref:AAA family ATPase n=1 Tax=Uliginosibacterium gangwonense TaxID=392736 RepID=UPI0003737BC2|nr:AAA family ATPase [Uliginosibacterium gangwonense]
MIHEEMIEAANLASLRSGSSLRGAHYANLLDCVAAPGHTPDWKALQDLLPALLPLARTPQAPRYHGEGDVWTHTQMVTEAMCSLPDYAAACAERRFTLFYAALLHDIAKPACTRIDPATGHIGQPAHSAHGAIDARIILWRSGVPFALREAICRLIFAHQMPFFALHGNRAGHSTEFIVSRLSHALCIRDLAALAEADMRGRVYAEVEEVLLEIELFRELAREEGCFDTPRRFADPRVRMRYFNGADLHPDYEYHHEPGSRVTVLSGLPATGKNTWIAHNSAGRPVVGFDDAREALGLKHGENDGRAAHYAVEQAKSLLRAKAPFIWNATHLSRQMRGKTLDLLYAYGAEVEVVYLEAPENIILARNTKRDTTLKNEAILHMLHRWEVVQPDEADHVCYLGQAAAESKTLR